MPRRLIFAGKQMGDEKQAKDYNVEGGSVLHLVSSCLQAARRALLRLFCLSGRDRHLWLYVFATLCTSMVALWRCRYWRSVAAHNSERTARPPTELVQG